MASETTSINLTIGTQSIVLAPSAKATAAVSRLKGGLIPAINAAATFDIDVIVAIVAIGSDKKPQDLAEAIYENGIAPIAAKVIDYVHLLATGGRTETGD